MKIIFFSLWLITIVAGSILGTIVPPSLDLLPVVWL